MKLLIALGVKTGDRTPYTMTQVEDHAYEDYLVRGFVEEDILTVLQHDYQGIPARLLWIEQEGFVPPDMDFLRALADGADIPWAVLEERDLTGGPEAS